ncbi:MAG: hypothetical protein AB8G15_03925 [Saprospiraceae bacterium]
MKTLKFNSIFFALLATLSCAILFTACSKEDLTPALTTEVTTASPNTEVKMLLPESITAKGEESVKAYLKNMSIEQRVKHINDYTISEYLTQKGKIQNLDPLGDRIGLPSDLNLSDYLSGEEIKTLKSKLITTEEALNQERLGTECILVFVLVDVEEIEGTDLLIYTYELVYISCTTEIE